MRRHSPDVVRLRRVLLFSTCLLLCALAASEPLTGRFVADASRGPRPSAGAGQNGAGRLRLSEALGALPLRFEENRGQTGPEVKFLARGAGYTLFLTRAGATLRLLKAAGGGEAGEEERPDAAPLVGSLRFGLEGSNRASKVVGLDEQGSKSNYLVGANARAWRTGVANFGRVKYESVYPGIDLVYYGREGRLEYDFLVAPGARPGRIRLGFDGARSTRVDENGDLVITTGAGDVRQQKPVAYQEAGGRRREVAARYVKDAGGAVRFELGEYDRGLPLVIDPVLLYSSYLGGAAGDDGLAVAVDSAGSAYVAGSTTSADFPGPSPLQGSISAFHDAFILKLSPDGKTLVYATYLGGNGDDIANSIAVDSTGSAYVAGLTGSGSFPATPGAFQDTKSASLDAFVAKLSPSGASLSYATYLGGNGNEQVYSIAVDAAGAAYVAGRTDSFSFTRVFGVTRAGNPAYRSADGGANWAASSNGLTASIVNDFAFAPAASDTVYAATNLGVYKSTDGGINWQLTGQSRTSTAPLFTKAVVVDPSNPSIVYAGTSSGSGVYKSTDGGVTYEQKGNGLTLPSVNTLAVNPSAPSTLYAGSPFGIFKSTNGGETWSDARGQLTGSTPNVNRVVIDPVNPQNVYAATANRGLLKSTDGGASWSPSNNGLAPGLFSPSVRTVEIDPSNPSTLYVSLSGSGAGVYKSTDGGANWTRASNGLSLGNGEQAFPLTPSYLLVDPATPSNVYAATNAGVYRSADGGANWAASSNGLTNRVILALGVRPASPGVILAGAAVGSDAFAMKLAPSGAYPEYLRLLGGAENDEAHGIALGADGGVYVTGNTSSSDFPVANAYQPALNSGSTDAFLTKIDASGAIVYSTFLGGSSVEEGRGVAAGPGGTAYVTGSTFSNDFPLANALQPVRGELFGMREAFVTKFAADGRSLEYSTYLGGNGDDQAFGIAVGADGSASVTGVTGSTNFPLVGALSGGPGGNADAFVSKLNPAGTALLFSTYLGGSLFDQGNGVATDSAGNIYVVGSTSSSDFPVANAVRGASGGFGDAFVAKIGADADLSLTNADSRDPVMVGNPLTYTLTVRNAGADVAAGVVVTDTLPSGVAFVSASASQGACTGTSTLTCNLGSMAAGASATINVVVTPQAAGTITNAASVTSGTPDRDTSNNSAAQQTRVSALPSIAGRVTTAGGAGVGSVNVALSGSQTAGTATAADGFYQFGDLAAGGSYTVTPSRQGFVFHPQSQSFPNLSADATADFSAVACVFQIAPRNASFPAAGGSGSVTVTAPDALCPWTATSDVPWITVTSGPGAAGTGTVTFTVAPAAGSRSGTLRIAGNVFTVWQEVTPCDTPGFTSASRIADSTAGFRVLSRDFNNDGRPDLAVAADKVIRVLLNAGGGVFNPSADLPVTGFQFRGIASGDFNGDGKFDLVSVSNSGGGFPGFVTLRLGDGAGNFAAPVNFNVGTNPSAADTGDFNNDGRDDLAVANENSGSLSVLLGSASTGLAQAREIGNANRIPQPTALAVGDYNRDGKSDVALLGAFGVAVVLGDGAGDFGTPKFFNSGVFETFQLTAGDIDADGNLDLVVAGNNLAVLKGDGAGGFSAPAYLVTGTFSSDVIIADLSGDGRRDVAAANIGSGGVPVFLANTSGGLTQSAAYLAGSSPRALVAGDFDGDGRKDMVVVDSGAFFNGGGVYLLKGDGAGGFRAARDFYVLNPQDLARADFNGDGRDDLVVANGNGVVFGNVYFAPAGPGGLFGTPTLISSDVRPRSVAARDFNRDGKPDLAVFEADTASNGSKSRLKIFLGNGAGGFTLTGDTLLDTFLPLIVYGDFNGDGNIDVVTGGTGLGLVLRPGDGAGHFGPPAAFANSVNVARLAAGDFNGDGRTDIVVVPEGGDCGTGDGTVSLQVFQSDGAGGFSAPVSTSFSGSVIDLRPYDFNGDGREDLAVVNRCNRKVGLLASNGAGGFTLAGEFQVTKTPLKLSLGDFNGDGREDLAVVDSDPQNDESLLTILTGDGVGGFGSPVTLNVGRTPFVVAVGDFDGNGRDDLATSNLGASHVGIFLNSCPVSLSNSTVQFDAASYNAGEGTGAVNVTVTRAGEASAAASVRYSTQPGTASPRSDYTTAVGTLRFAPGERTKSFQVLLTDDALAEGAESLTLTLDEPAGAALGAQRSATLNIADNDAAPAPNPADDPQFFVRQHYHDFLNREPDAAGLAFWTNEITQCGTNPGCVEVKRINVSAAFFLSIEFQETGYLVYRFYKAAYGDTSSPNVNAPVPVVRLEDFLPDTQEIGQGVQVNVGDWQAQLEANKNAYALGFVQRPRFLAAFPQTLTPTQFVEQLDRNAGGVLTQQEREQLIANLAADNTPHGRAVALRQVAENAVLRQREINRAFVLMQYFGYLRRNPDDPQDRDFRGWKFWLDKLQQFNGNFIQAEMVKAFISSDEYRRRFGQ